MNFVLFCGGPGKCVIACINISHFRLYDCSVTSTGAIALGEGLQENNSLEKLEYVTNALIDGIHCRYSRDAIFSGPEDLGTKVDVPRT